MQGVLIYREKGEGRGGGSVDQWGLNQGERKDRGYQVKGIQSLLGRCNKETPVQYAKQTN